MKITGILTHLLLASLLLVCFQSNGQLLNNNALLSQDQPFVPSFDVMHYQAGAPSTSKANVAARQLALEPSVAGADRAMSWSIWFEVANINTNTIRVFCNGLTASGTNQYSLDVNTQNTTNAAINQKLQFNMATSAGNAITIASTDKFLKNRWYHVVITYSGSETAAGLNMYLNGVLDSTATKNTVGTYTGALNDANLRFQTSVVPTTSANKFGGDQMDLAIWDIALNQTQVNELFNDGLPFDVSTASFYGNIEAYWPQRTDLICANDVTFNLGSAVAIATRNLPVGIDYKKLSIFNAQIGTTQYIAFGRIINRIGDEYSWYGRRGTTHVAGGDIVKIDLDPSAMTANAAVVVNNETNDLRGGTAGVIDGDVLSFSAESTTSGTVFTVNDRFESTDGLTGVTFGASSTMPTTESAFCFYGNVVDGPSAGEYFIPWYEFTAGTPLYKVQLYKRDVSGVYTTQTIYSGTTPYTETGIVKVNATTYFALLRRNTGGGLFLSVSTDNGSTWSAPASTGLGSGICMADMTLSPTGQIVAVFCDRADNGAYIIFGDPAALLADPTDWYDLSKFFHSYSTDSVGILGYPAIVRNGVNYAISLSTEKSSGVADIYFAYGHLGLGETTP